MVRSTASPLVTALIAALAGCASAPLEPPPPKPDVDPVVREPTELELRMSLDSDDPARVSEAVVTLDKKLEPSKMASQETLLDRAIRTSRRAHIRQAALLELWPRLTADARATIAWTVAQRWMVWFVQDPSRLHDTFKWQVAARASRDEELPLRIRKLTASRLAQADPEAALAALKDLRPLMTRDLAARADLETGDAAAVGAALVRLHGKRGPAPGTTRAEAILAAKPAVLAHVVEAAPGLDSEALEILLALQGPAVASAPATPPELLARIARHGELPADVRWAAARRWRETATPAELKALLGQRVLPLVTEIALASEGLRGRKKAAAAEQLVRERRRCADLRELAAQRRLPRGLSRPVRRLLACLGRGRGCDRIGDEALAERAERCRPTEAEEATP